MRGLVLILTLTLMLPGCAIRRIGIPKVHRITIQQGNVITQDMVDKLKPGMTKRQVLFVMGEPVVKSPFEHDRWDYIYTIKPPRQPTAQSRMTLFFEDDGLVRFTGNFVPTERESPDPPAESAAG